MFFEHFEILVGIAEYDLNKKHVMNKIKKAVKTTISILSITHAVIKFIFNFFSKNYVQRSVLTYKLINNLF